MRGHIGHQVLAQLLIAEFTYAQVELAGAGVVVAMSGRRRGVLARAAIGTAAPALALQRMESRIDGRLRRREKIIRAREDALREAFGALEQARRESQTQHDALIAENQELRRKLADCESIVRAVPIADEDRIAPYEPVESAATIELSEPIVDEAPTRVGPTVLVPAKPSKPKKPKPGKPPRKGKGGKPR